MSESASDPPTPQKKSKTRKFVFISKGTYLKANKKHHTPSPSNQKRRGSTSGAETLQVIQKVRKHPDFKQLGNNELQEQAENLINPEYFQDYFSEFNEHHVQEVLCNIGSEASAETEGHEAGAAATRATVRIADMQNINVKLQLRKLYTWSQGAVAKFASMVAAEYGPTHAALLIGNNENGYVMLEWDGTSLIVPQYYYPENHEDVVFEARVATPVSPVDRELLDEARVAGEQLDYDQQIDLVFDAAVERKKMFEELFRVVIKYNKYFQYHIFSRNCQHFVRDAMEALKVQNPHVGFTGRLKTYFEQLRKGVSQVDFRSHSDLDDHVTTRLRDATQQELEYYMCIYLQFHAVGRSQSSEQDPTKWRCEEPSCKCDDVDLRIKEQESVLSRFLQQSQS